nr:NADH dehydrogenase subunit 5 [Peloridora minuta]
MVLFSLYTLVYVLLLGLSLVCFFLGVLFLLNVKMIIVEWLLLSLNSGTVSYTMLFDWMSFLFMGVVFFISCMVVLYSSDYMSSDLYMNRFVILVFLFVVSMILVITSFNLMGILLGWDGLGLISYCLVIYFQNRGSYSAGMLTALINRLGDASLIVGICWMLNYGCWHYLFYFDSFFMKYIIIFIVLASFTSSAQIPFSSWLPAAMAAPTPISALVHSSTLVTAGVYLMIRFSSSLVMLDCGIFMFLSIITMIMAGGCAVVEYDMSSIVALSTLGQLGLMMSCLLAGFSELCFFHLLTHALFKSLMFLCLGVYIHGYGGNQDIRFVGLVFLSYPFVSVCFCISSFSLSAMPFLSGYYSSDLIMEFISMGTLNMMLFLFFYLSAFLTVIYNFRMIYYSLIVDNTRLVSFLVGGEISINLFCIAILSIMSVVMGNVLFWFTLVKPVFTLLPTLIKIFPLLLFFMGLLVFMEYLGYLALGGAGKWLLIMEFSNLMWFFPKLMSLFGLLVLKWTYLINNYLGGGWLEDYGSRGITKFLFVYSLELYSLSFNTISIFFIWMLVLCLFLFFIS